MSAKTKTRVPVAILISGRGSNMAALLDAAREPGYPAEVKLVISNRPDAAGLDLAAKRNTRTLVIDHTKFPDRNDFDTMLGNTLAEADIEYVCLAGFMRLLGRPFVERWRERVINIHPSLLPAFRGLHTHQRVLASGVRITGCTVHFVRPDMDDGPIILQAAVPVHEDDSEESLAARVLAAEHRCYPAALRWLAEGRISLRGERVALQGVTSQEHNLISPALDS